MGSDTDITCLGNMALLSVPSHTRELISCSGIHTEPRAEILGSKFWFCHLVSRLVLGAKLVSWPLITYSYLSWGKTILHFPPPLAVVVNANEQMDGRSFALHVGDYQGCNCSLS